VKVVSSFDGLRMHLTAAPGRDLPALNLSC
jgi:hypothetical protein